MTKGRLSKWTIRRLAEGDAEALAGFYNGRSESSRRTFRPLGWWTTTAEACAKVVRDNVLYDNITCENVAHDAQLAAPKYDLVAWHLGQIVGWSFVWNVHSAEPTFGLGVADAYHRKGLGSRLMDRVLEAAQSLGLKKIYLTVVQDNRVAWQMYARRGFSRYGEFVDERDGLAYYRMAIDL
jgi:ribosomal protein S18 acetylase RimI-like enzyme